MISYDIILTFGQHHMIYQYLQITSPISDQGTTWRALLRAIAQGFGARLRNWHKFLNPLRARRTDSSFQSCQKCNPKWQIEVPCKKMHSIDYSTVSPSSGAVAVCKSKTHSNLPQCKRTGRFLQLHARGDFKFVIIPHGSNDHTFHPSTDKAQTSVRWLLGKSFIMIYIFHPRIKVC